MLSAMSVEDSDISLEIVKKMTEEEEIEKDKDLLEDKLNATSVEDLDTWPKTVRIKKEEVLREDEKVIVNQEEKEEMMEDPSVSIVKNTDI